MFRSVRAGGLAAAAFVTSLFGATAPVHAQTVDAPLAVPSAIAPIQAQPVTSTAGPIVLPAELFRAPAPAAPVAPVAPHIKASLEDLTSTLAATETTDATHECLATAVYFEARGEPLAGQLAVAEVVLNRSRSGQYPSDVCSVVKQPAQFSFVRKGRFPAADRSSDCWRRAVAIAKIAQDKLVTKLPQNVLWYHATYVAPSWGKRLTRQAKIGLHIFYS